MIFIIYCFQVTILYFQNNANLSNTLIIHLQTNFIFFLELLIVYYILNLNIPFYNLLILIFLFMEDHLL